MKKEPLTIMVVPHANGTVHNIKIPIPYVYAIGSVLAISILFFIYFVYDYASIRKEIIVLKPYNTELMKKNNMLEEDKKNQESELKNLNKILVQLKKFDNKIRIMTGLELRKDEEKKSVGGQGGPVSKEDNIVFKEKMYNIASLNLPSGTNPYQQTLREYFLQKKSFEELQGFLEEQEDLLLSTPSIWPVKGWVISEYGYRISPFTGGREMHDGIDISARVGTPVLASADGVVEFTGIKGYLGQIIIIDHSYGFKTLYGHNEKILVRQGQKVKRGQIIATLGNSGKTIRPHLHYEVLLKGEKVDPNKYLIN